MVSLAADASGINLLFRRSRPCQLSMTVTGHGTFDRYRLDRGPGSICWVGRCGVTEVLSTIVPVSPSRRTIWQVSPLNSLSSTWTVKVPDGLNDSESPRITFSGMLASPALFSTLISQKSLLGSSRSRPVACICHIDSPNACWPGTVDLLPPSRSVSVTEQPVSPVAAVALSKMCRRQGPVDSTTLFLKLNPGAGEEKTL